MFMLIYKKSTSIVVSIRCDEPSSQPLPADTWFNIYLKDNKISASDALDFAYVEIERIELAFDVNKYMWNESTQQVDLNPAYVAPIPAPETKEPTPPAEPTK